MGAAGVVSADGVACRAAWLAPCLRVGARNETCRCFRELPEVLSRAAPAVVTSKAQGPPTITRVPKDAFSKSCQTVSQAGAPEFIFSLNSSRMSAFPQAVFTNDDVNPQLVGLPPRA
ncbi:unnamed protein product [Lepidochelys kempii]